MGVEHFLVCKTCKEYIDLHKLRGCGVDMMMYQSRPPIDSDEDENGKPDHSGMIKSNYWVDRFVWFLWNHRSHETEMHTDMEDDWYDYAPTLKEVFPHYEDIKLREKDKKNG